MNAPDQTRANARAFFMRLVVSGQGLNGIRPDQCGRWAEYAEDVLYDYCEGGTERARRRFAELAAQDAELASLLAGDDPSPRERTTRWSADDLLAAEFPPVPWVIPGLLPAGLTILAGRPKLGKSWFCLQMAAAVAAGGVLFSERVEAGKVLYLALEDGARRLQSRLRLQRWPAGAAATFCTEWRRFDAGGLDALREELSRESYRLLVLDTFARLLGRADQSEVGAMTAALDPLQRFAVDNDMAVLVVDHHPKPKGANPDPVDDILGSTAKGGVADCAAGLYRERGKQGAVLRVAGRDLPDDRKLALQWDGYSCTWQLVGDADDVEQASVQGAILAALGALGGEATTQELAEYLDKPKGNISRELAELTGKGRVRRGEKRGREVPYRLAVNHDNNDNHDNHAIA